ncbi:N-acetyltransferase [Clostridium grantii]|uniref:Serine O-acetyltransferase n=1 Tax=Clostridium grantii DSM 8605 TaxID=1121316 RepID=A0A1M5SLT0_9CLOT|nr:acyltransferase [Clostridium grantii]SHH39521.1 serine O-acetyltransferase [Clostridium grantii DSM 8605]
MNYISEKAVLGSNVSVGKFAVIEDNVQIGENCLIGNNVVIHSGSNIGNNVRIDDNSVIGKKPMRAVTSIFKDDKEYEGALIKDQCLIGAGVIIYCGCTIGNNTLVADQAVIREDVSIKEKTIIGKGATIENFCTVGMNCKIQTNVYLTAYSVVEDYVFIGPCVVTSNDNYAARSKERFKHFKGVTIKKGARIGAGAVILPGVTINEDGFAAAGSIVTKDVAKAKIVKGSPAKYFRDVPVDQLLENQ